jgi:hypothetical protein
MNAARPNNAIYDFGFWIYDLRFWIDRKRLRWMKKPSKTERKDWR